MFEVFGWEFQHYVWPRGCQVVFAFILEHVLEPLWAPKRIPKQPFFAGHVETTVRVAIFLFEVELTQIYNLPSILWSHFWAPRRIPNQRFCRGYVEQTACVARSFLRSIFRRVTAPRAFYGAIVVRQRGSQICDFVLDMWKKRLVLQDHLLRRFTTPPEENHQVLRLFTGSRWVL